MIGSISVEVSITPEVGGGAAVASPVRALELDTHSSSDADPSESLPLLISVAPMVSPHMCSDDLESDTEIPERHVSPTPHDFPLAPIVAPPGIHQRRAILIQHKEDITIGPLYRTHPGGPYRALTVRHSISGHSLSRHASSDTTVADSSTTPRFVYPPLARTSWCSETYLRWRSAPLSTIYPPTPSESSVGDSSSESSAGPSCKRCRSHAATVISSIYTTGAIVPSRADLLLPCKRFRDFISPEDNVEEDIDIVVLEDNEADATAIEGLVDKDVVTGLMQVLIWRSMLGLM
ncbi:hypothetical protein Tco_0911950 [Tanacetum coccineum]